MKKLGIMFALAGVITFGLSSCGGDDEEVAKPTPKFDFKTGAGFTSASGNINAGNTVKIGIEASGSENLESVGVRAQVGTAQQTIFPLASTGDSILASKTKDISLDFEYQVGSLPTTEKITVIVKMSNGTQTSKTINLTVSAAAKPVTDAPGRQIGGQTNASYGSYWSMEVNSSKLQSEANADPASIDWVYYYGSTNDATFAAPNDATLQSSNVMNNPNLSTWGTKNATKFKKASAGFDFDGLTTSTQLLSEISAGAPALTAITKMQNGDVYIFVTEGGKEYGAIKIVSNTPTTSQSLLTFDMKFVSEQ